MNVLGIVLGIPLGIPFFFQNLECYKQLT